jgi:hypothetical protein
MCRFYRVKIVSKDLQQNRDGGVLSSKVEFSADELSGMNVDLEA